MKPVPTCASGHVDFTVKKIDIILSNNARIQALQFTLTFFKRKIFDLPILKANFQVIFNVEGFIIKTSISEQTDENPIPIWMMECFWMNHFDLISI
jgi:hypothetical protein